MQNDEKLITYAEAARWLTERGQRRSRMALWSWANRGTAAGVRLEKTQLGDRQYTTVAAVKRFMDRCARASGADVTVLEV